MFASVAALVALPFLAQSVAAADCAREYTVKEGDICDTISQNHNVSTYQLAVTNPGIDTSCNNLQIGKKYCLGYVGEDCTTTYVVKKDDTCDKIIQGHSINSTLLYANNPQINADCTNIYIGEVLCAAPSFAAPAPPAVIPATAIPAGATPAVPQPTPAATTSVAAPAITSAAPSDDDDDDDEDDDDLPFCDEL